VNRSVLARTEDTSAGRYSPICIVAHVDVNQPEAAIQIELQSFFDSIQISLGKKVRHPKELDVF